MFVVFCHSESYRRLQLHTVHFGRTLKMLLSTLLSFVLGNKASLSFQALLSVYQLEHKGKCCLVFAFNGKRSSKNYLFPEHGTKTRPMHGYGNKMRQPMWKKDVNSRMGMCFKWVYTKALHLVWDILHINSRRKYLENLFECARFLSLLWNIRYLGSPGYLNWKLRDKFKRQVIRLKFGPGHRCHQVWGCCDQGQNPCEILMVARNHPASKITSTEGTPDLL